MRRARVATTSQRGPLGSHLQCTQNQSQDGMCFCQLPGIGPGVLQECLGPCLKNCPAPSFQLRPVRLANPPRKLPTLSGTASLVPKHRFPIASSLAQPQIVSSALKSWPQPGRFTSPLDRNHNGTGIGTLRLSATLRESYLGQYTATGENPTTWTSGSDTHGAEASGAGPCPRTWNVAGGRESSRGFRYLRFSY